MDTKERVIQVLMRVGLITNSADDLAEGSQVEISSQIDSIQYMSAIVELEQEFGIEIPEEYIVENMFTSIEHVASIVEDLKAE